VSGGDQRKLILREHLLSAEARGQSQYVRDIRHALPLVPTGRAARAIRYAHDARGHRNFAGMFGALAFALVLSPRVTLDLTLKQARLDVSGRSRASSPAPKDAN
jgi:hypothetical protein